MKLKVGDVAPDFVLPDQNGKEHKLSNYKGKWVLIYFYPKDNTPGWTKEACQIRDKFDDFENLKAKVFGISVDSVKSHDSFAQKYKLPFAILADEEKKVVSLYDVWGVKNFMGRVYMGLNRTSFLVDPKGKIAKIYQKVKPDIHAQEVLRDLTQWNIK